MKKIHILHMYPNELNTYGDRGNVLVLTRRITQYGFEPVMHHHHVGDKLPEKVDLIFGGGGEDAAQRKVHADFMKHGPAVRALVEKGVPLLSVCGLYQLCGNRFITKDGDEIRGIGLFDLESRGESPRLIGNMQAQTANFGTLYGFQNHSGRTYLAAGQAPLGTTVTGAGNNGKDGTEGARTHNAFGTYMHGPVLPLNPAFGDALIFMAIQHAGETPPKALPYSQYVMMAREDARKRLA